FGPNNSADLCLRRERKILLNVFLLHDPWDLSATLIHEMIHAAGIRFHGERFAHEASRLLDIGAPLDDTDAVSWQLERAISQRLKDKKIAKTGTRNRRDRKST